MATYSVNTGSDSDTTQAINCDTCKLDNMKKPAEGYCTECLEYLCHECFQIHCRPGRMRHHKLVGKDKMPKRQISSDVVDNKCDCSHKDDANFYCENHQKLLCVNCIVYIHKDCRYMNLSERSKDTENSKEYSEFLKDLDESEHLFKVRKDLSNQHKENCNKSFKQVFQDINFQKKILQEKMEAVNALEKEAIKMRDGYERTMQGIEHSNGRAVRDVRSIRDDLTALQDMAQCQKLFIALHRSKSCLKQLKERMAQTNTENIPQTYVYVPNDVMNNMLINIAEVGQLSELKNSNGSITVDRNSAELYPEYGLPKCIAMSENCIAVIDYIHNTLQKVQDGRTVAQINLSSGPWDIARVSSTQVVVSHPMEEKVSFINLENRTIRISKEIKVNCRCEGIAYADDKLFIASSNPACLVIYNTKESNEENRITTDEHGVSLFLQPAYIDVHPLKHLICLSDRKANKVFVFNWTGALSNVFGCDDMKMPLAIAFRDETVVVVGFESNTINIISFEKHNERAIETRCLNDLAIDRLFNDSSFKMNACWQYCAGKYFAVACKRN